MLSSWMSLFFIVFLVPLPVAPLPNWEITLKIFGVLIFGFLFTILGGSGIFLLLRKCVLARRHTYEPGKTEEVAATTAATEAHEPVKMAQAQAIRRYCLCLFGGWIGVVLLLWGVAIVLREVDPYSATPPLLIICLHLSVSFACYILVSRLTPKFILAVIPGTFLCALLIALVICVTTFKPWRETLAIYQRSRVELFAAKKTPHGAADVISCLLGPSVANLSVKVLQARDRVRASIWTLLAALVINTVLSLIVPAIALRLCSVPRLYALSVCIFY